MADGITVLWITLTVIACVGGSILLVMLYIQLTTGRCKSKRRLDGKTAIVTGSNIGIGLETARDFAARGAKVILACRSVEKANEAKDDIVKTTGNQDVVVRKLDLSSFSSVRQFAQEILESEARLDILVNNAGAMGMGKKFTEDNLLLGMQSNHFGPFLLTNLLIGLLKKSTPSRIVTVSSTMHKMSTFDIDNMNAEKSFGDAMMYSYSKLANILMSNELAKRLDGTGVTSNSLHPGVINSAFGRNWPFYLRWIFWLPGVLFFKNVKEGAQTSIYLAVSEEVEGVTGKYFSDCKEVQPSSAAKDEKLAKKVWEKSIDLVKLKPTELKL